MANALYDAGRDGFLLGQIDWDTDDIRAILIDTSAYTVNLSSHDFLNDVPGGARVAVAALTSEASLGANGTADAADVTFPSVPGGDTVSAVIIYKHTGTESTSRLIAYYDTVTNMPLATNGGDITLQFHTSGLFKL